MSLDGASILNNFLDVYLQQAIGSLDRSIRCIITQAATVASFISEGSRS
jgi:hypothetical protein